MKVEIEVSVKQKKIIEVEFPIYRSNYDSTEDGSWETSTRIDQDGMICSITIRRSFRSDEHEWEMSIHKVNTTNYGGYVAPSYGIESTREAFDKIMKQFTERMARFVNLPPER